MKGEQRREGKIHDNDVYFWATFTESQPDSARHKTIKLKACYNFIKDNETDLVKDSSEGEQMNEISPMNESYKRRIRSLENIV